VADDFACPTCGGHCDFINELKKLVKETLQEIIREENERVFREFVFGNGEFKPRGVNPPPEGVKYFDYPGPAPTDGAGETLDG